MLQDLVGNQKVERIAILVSYNGTSKFLGAPKILTGTGENIANAVYNTLVDWEVHEKIAGMGFDTTSSNTGNKSGACLYLQKMIGRNLINLACRHHIYEIVLRSVFDLKLSTSSAPDVLIFDRFRKSWINLDKKLFKSGIEDETVQQLISSEECEDLKMFCQLQLTRPQIRDDYKEFLKLSLTFLGEAGGAFFTPGPTSHARWMAKGIYSLKLFLFRDQFSMRKKELNGIRDVCVFIILLYVKVWFGCTNAIVAPNQDLCFIKNVIKYKEKDSTVSNAILQKIKNHLWYLSEQTVALAFFDVAVCLDEKKLMVQQLKSREPIIKLKDGRSSNNEAIFIDAKLSDFVSHRTKQFFTSFGLPHDFLQFEPSTWESNEDFQECLRFCHQLPVVNDTAERGVKFMKDYNKVLTNNEEEKQMVLQIVESYKKKYPNANKNNLI